MAHEVYSSLIVWKMFLSTSFKPLTSEIPSATVPDPFLFNDLLPPKFTFEDNCFTVSPTSFALDTGEEVVIEVEFRPSEVGCMSRGLSRVTWFVTCHVVCNMSRGLSRGTRSVTWYAECHVF